MKRDKVSLRKFGMWAILLCASLSLVIPCIAAGSENGTAEKSANKLTRARHSTAHYSDRSYQTGIGCHLVPTHKCWIMAGVSGDASNNGYVIAGLQITLKTDNIYIPNGIYDGIIEIGNGNSVLAKHPVEISVNNGHVSLARVDAAKRWIDKNKSREFNVIRWKSDGILKPTALPLKVSDLSEKHGSMEAILMYDGHRVASSKLHMVPAKGCWIHERKCQPY